MAEENATETTTEPPGNDEAVISTEKEEKEQDSQQHGEETTEDSTVQPSTAEGDQSEVTEKREEADEPVKEGDGTDKNQIVKVSSSMEAEVSISVTEEEEKGREEQPQADAGEATEGKEVRIAFATFTQLRTSSTILVYHSFCFSSALNYATWCSTCITGSLCLSC